MTRELYDYIVEQRLSSTCGGLAENVKRKYITLIYRVQGLPKATEYHLLEYKLRMNEYLDAFEQSYQAYLKTPSFRQSPVLKPFSAPNDENGYNDTSITNDMINDVYAEFVIKTREADSAKYARTLTGREINFCS